MNAEVLNSIVAKMTSIESELRSVREILVKQAEIIKVQTDEIRDLKSVIYGKPTIPVDPNIRDAVPISKKDRKKVLENSSQMTVCENEPTLGRAAENLRHSRRNILIFSPPSPSEPVPTIEIAPPAATTEVSDNNQDTNTGNVQTCENEWKRVQYKKRRAPLSLRCVAGPSVTSLKAAETRKHFHLWNMVSSLDEIKKYLSELCPQRIMTVEQLHTANDYNSFKIGVPEDCYDKCFSVNVWPDNARVKKWINYKKRASTQASQTFRHGVGT